MNPMNHQHTVLNHLPSGAPLPGLWFLKSLLWLCSWGLCFHMNCLDDFLKIHWQLGPLNSSVLQWELVIILVDL